MSSFEESDSQKSNDDSSSQEDESPDAKSSLEKNNSPEKQPKQRNNTDRKLIDKLSQLQEQNPEKLEKLLSLLSSERKELRQVSSQFSGPIPPPELLEGYENIVPGAADRIIRMTERQIDHRTNIESLIVKGDNRRADRGLTFAFMLGILCIVVAATLAYLGQPNVAIVIIVVLFGTGTTTYIYGTNVRKQERKNKTEGLLKSLLKDSTNGD